MREKPEELTIEERRRRLEERLRQPIPRKLKPAVVVQAEPITDPKVVAAVKANPESVRVRVTAQAEDGTTVVDRPRPTERLEVVEVDAMGRPKLARRYDALTGQWGIVEFEQGYRKPSGAVSDYDPYRRGLE